MALGGKYEVDGVPADELGFVDRHRNWTGQDRSGALHPVRLPAGCTLTGSTKFRSSQARDLTIAPGEHNGLAAFDLDPFWGIHACEDTTHREL
jgi:hypothetical protein